MIQVDDIVKAYGATTAVDHVSFRVDAGEILGFLGPNGAGKSTTLKILTCYIVADSGRVTVNGYDVLQESLAVRESVGYLPENTPLYSDMQVDEYLRFVAKARQIPNARIKAAIDLAVERVQIERMLKKNVGHLSKGYRQRVGLAQALIHDPPILILDEPTSGLDPHQIIEIRKLLRELGKTKVVLFSSHILQEISAICSRIMVISDGRIVADGKPEELQKQTTSRESFRARVEGPADEVRGKLSGLEGVDNVDVLNDKLGDYRIVGKEGAELGAGIFGVVKDNQWVLTSLQPEWRTLEEMYLQLTVSGAAESKAS